MRGAKDHVEDYCTSLGDSIRVPLVDYRANEQQPYEPLLEHQLKEGDGS